MESPKSPHELTPPPADATLAYGKKKLHHLGVLKAAMRLTSGITFKLFVWYFLFVLIFCGVVLLLYTNVRQIMKISENIVNKNYIISSYSKKMIENLLDVEENEQKYLLLGKKAYLDYAASSRKAFAEHLDAILRLESGETTISGLWKDLGDNYKKMVSSAEKLVKKDGIYPMGTVWIPENDITDWIKLISETRNILISITN